MQTVFHKTFSSFHSGTCRFARHSARSIRAAGTARLEEGLNACHCKLDNRRG